MIYYRFILKNRYLTQNSLNIINTYKLGLPLGGPSQKEWLFYRNLDNKSEIIWVLKDFPSQHHKRSAQLKMSLPNCDLRLLGILAQMPRTMIRGCWILSSVFKVSSRNFFQLNFHFSCESNSTDRNVCESVCWSVHWSVCL